jgi:preprotein translocase subunit SecE
MSKAAVIETNEHGTKQHGSNEHETAVERALSGPERLMQFLRDTRQEMTKVVAPTRAEVQANTIVVIITVFLFAAYFELVDLVFGKAIDQLFLHLTKH